MTTPLLLEGKHAAVFGAGGSIGAAVAKELAACGAEVFLAGRSAASIDLVAKHIEDAGGVAHARAVDTLDASAVDAFVASVVRETGSLDIAFNATGPRISEYGNGKAALDLTVDEFMTPVNTVLRSSFVTARAAAWQMREQGSGVIIFVTGSPARPHGPGTSGIGAAFGAIENLTRALALELGNAGVRVVCVRTAANSDSRTIRDTTEVMARLMNITPQQAAGALAQQTMLKLSPQTTDTAKAAAFLASEDARMITGAVLNASAGAVTD
jgi:NAD(P)-dependent dehydrogenase (short-subunit alcohol dehydrogenase family)